MSRLIGSSLFPGSLSSDNLSDAPRQGVRKSRTKWTTIEDGVLISAWLNTSKDPIVDNEQKAETFWKRIAAYLASCPKLAGLKKREPNHCKQRWAKINKGVCRFVGSYDAATKEKSSGQNENDIVNLAHEIFFNDYKVKFTLEHAWRELRHNQKWCGSSTKDIGRPKRRKCDDQSAQSSTCMQGSLGEDEAMARSLGVKAANDKTKRSMSKPNIVEEEGKAMLEFQSMWEIKQKDFALKEKLSKHKLLESLLAKSDISELEMALKNKLINDMLSNG